MTSEEHTARAPQEDSVDFTDVQVAAFREDAKEESKKGAVARAILDVMVEEDDVPQPDDGYVYVAEAEPGVVKIGKSVRPKERLRSLSTGSAYELTLLAKNEVPNSHKMESKIQRRFDDYRMRGEWFEVPESVKQDIIEEVEAL